MQLQDVIFTYGADLVVMHQLELNTIFKQFGQNITFSHFVRHFGSLSSLLIQFLIFQLWPKIDFVERFACCWCRGNIKKYDQLLSQNCPCADACSVLTSNGGYGCVCAYFKCVFTTSMKRNRNCKRWTQRKLLSQKRELAPYNFLFNESALLIILQIRIIYFRLLLDFNFNGNK